MSTVYKVIAAAILAVVLFKPALVDQTIAAGLGGKAPAGAGQAVAATRDGNARAVNYLDKKTQAAAANARVGALGYPMGATHFKEVHPGYRWSSCAPVRFVLNTSHAPKGAVADFALAIRKMRQATGLDLRVVGATAATPTPAWAASAGQSTWNPVMVSWGAYPTGILSSPEVSGTAAARGVTNSSGQRVYVSGQITFNVANDPIYTPGFGQYGSRVALEMHEIGHIIGLDHVDDPNQLMYTTVSGVADAGAGDLAGLAKLGQGGCRTIPTP